MKILKVISLFAIISISESAFGQTPDYSQLTKFEKLKLLNFYGYIETTSGDTIFCVLKHYKKGMLVVKFPKELKKFSSKESYPIDEVHSYYQGNPKDYRYIKRFDTEYLAIKRIVKGPISLYRNEFSQYTMPNGLYSIY